MKSPEPRFVGITRGPDNVSKLTVIGKDYNVYEMVLTIELAHKLAEDLLVAAADMLNVTQSGNHTQPDMFIQETTT